MGRVVGSFGDGNEGWDELRVRVCCFGSVGSCLGGSRDLIVGLGGGRRKVVTVVLYIVRGMGTMGIGTAFAAGERSKC